MKDIQLKKHQMMFRGLETTTKKIIRLIYLFERKSDDSSKKTFNYHFGDKF